MVRFRCGGCAQKIGVPDSYRGKRVKCPKCSRVALVPHEVPHGGQSYQVKQSPDVLAGPGAAQGSAWTATTAEGRRHDSSGPAWIDYLRASKALVFVSFLITFFGTFWLLGELEVLPPLHWLWTLGLAGTGVLSMDFPMAQVIQLRQECGRGALAVQRDFAILGEGHGYAWSNVPRAHDARGVARRGPPQAGADGGGSQQWCQEQRSGEAICLHGGTFQESPSASDAPASGANSRHRSGQVQVADACLLPYTLAIRIAQSPAS